MGDREICKWFGFCPLKRYYEEGRLDQKWIQDYCYHNYLRCVRYKMEEDGLCHPDNMMPDGSINGDLDG